jgi:hypothetical protein
MQSSRPVHNPNSRINDKLYTIILLMIGNKIEAKNHARLVENQNFCFTGVNIKTPVLTIMVKDVNFTLKTCGCFG